MEWSENNSYLKLILYTINSLPDPTRIAAFDLDDTLIQKPKKDREWELLDKSIPQKIAELVHDKYLIIIFSNQAGMSINKNFDKKKWKKEMEKFYEILFSKTKDKYYFAVYVAKKYDLYRKPNIGLWQQMKIDLMEEFKVNNIRISKKSFYCGDAGGRISSSIFKKKIYPTSLKGDFSDTDIKFALNIGINFITPEELLLVNTPKMVYKLSGIDPKKLLEELEEQPEYHFHPRKKELIILVGIPGSGKTEFYKKYIAPYKYVHINQDICKTKVKCLKLAKVAFEKGKSVVVDATNPDVLSRMQYTSLAKKYGYKHIRAIIMDTSIDIAKHLNNVRHVYSNGNIPKITNIAYGVFRKNFVRPQKSEYFDKIENIGFIFDKAKLEDPIWKKIFMRYSEL